MNKLSTTGIFLALSVMAAASQVSAQAVGQSEEPDLPDAVSTAIQERLSETGVIKRQADIGEDVIILQRENERIKALEGLLNTIGLEGFRKLYPELAEQIEASPLALRSQIEVVKLIRELEEAIEGPKEEAPAEEARQASANQGDTRPKGFIEMNIAPAGTIAGSMQLTPEELAELRDAERERARLEVEAEMAALQATPPISLREIYGSGADVYAIISIAGERIRVRPGDTLPGETIIQSIGTDSIDLLRNDEVVTLSIRG